MRHWFNHGAALTTTASFPLALSRMRQSQKQQTTNSNSSSSSSTSSTSSSSMNGAFANTTVPLEPLQEWMHEVDDGRGPFPTAPLLVDKASRTAQLSRKYEALERDVDRLAYELRKVPQFLATVSPWSVRPAKCALPSSTVRSGGASSSVLPTRGDMPVLPSGSSALFVSMLCASKGQRLPNATEDENGTTTTTSTGKSGALMRLQTATEEEQFAARAELMHRFYLLNYYSRMTLTPRKNFWLSLFSVAWNGWIGVQNAAAAMVTSVFHGYATTRSALGVAKAAARGTCLASKYLFYGWVVSPVAHLPSGLINSLCGVVNFLYGTLWFDASCGRYHTCDLRHVAVCKEDMLERTRLLKTIGHWEFLRKKMEPDSKMKEAMESLGFRVRLKREQRLKNRSAAGGGMFGSSKNAAGDDDTTKAQEDPYEVLQVKRNATTAQIKTQYKKLAKVFHPDVVAAQGTTEEKQDAAAKFESISEAYQVLSNPDKRSAYDNGGAQGLKMHESKAGRFVSTTPGGMVQGIFGGRAFQDRLMGELYKSHWDLRFQLRISVSTHEFECLQCIRVQLLALELAAMLDVHALGGEYQPSPYPSSGMPSSASNRNPTGTTMSSSSIGGASSSAKLSQRLTSSKTGKPSSQQQQQQQQDPLLQAHKKPGGAAGIGAAAADGSASQSPTSDPLLTPLIRPTYSSDPNSNPYTRFSPDFLARVEILVDRLTAASFGPELTYELGQAYIVCARRFLGLTPFYAPKIWVYRKVCAGFARIWEGFRAQIGEKTEEEIAKMILVEYFNMEFDNVMCDASLVLRYVVQLVLQDQGVTEEVRKKRSYALLYMGQRMVQKGRQWGQGRRDDVELTAYLQQAATSTPSTAPSPPF